ncbi:uncharacterized protein CPUR_08473 [Claviceps purpurea 20.1]|uniref:RING-type E3 ubiquitin transferase n=1 Tax=Claviceps purpurea (strain 20.1) TaxID=1111077 RepID=M1WD40_CLAP2|nr:uncharacterized protein CPUR_08473 [Claviceps purpurea 20.1]
MVIGVRLWSVLLILALAFVLALGQDDSITVLTSAHQDAPSWAAPSSLNLHLTTQPGGPVGVQFTVIPLTANIGLNGSVPLRGSVHIVGALKAANTSTYNDLRGNSTIAFLSCDGSSSDGNITADKMLARLMKASPLLTAIILYSTDKNICLINDDGPLPYSSILTMADAGEAGRVLTYLNGTQIVNSVDAEITGNTDHKSDSGPADGGGSSNSAVAMSILYSITGLITLLFLVIIATGAVRAHRYPERYGPRGGSGGRPRQSRAKGLARAVLETIPIVKFGNQEPAKPDPELELDAVTTTDGQNAPTAEDISAAPAASVAQSAEAKTAAAARTAMATARTSDDHISSKRESRVDGADGPADEHSENEAYLGCSICTEDFKVGEDVRVLPCNHQFHPHCVDPWLTNVSGTCPLCRLDLRPGRTTHEESSEYTVNLAPPLALEEEDPESPHAQHGNRLSRFFDVNRLRHAPVEERIEALRQMRAQTQYQDMSAQEATAADRPQAAKLTDKLKDKFRIRTRAQAAR